MFIMMNPNSWWRFGRLSKNYRMLQFRWYFTWILMWPSALMQCIGAWYLTLHEVKGQNGPFRFFFENGCGGVAKWDQTSQVISRVSYNSISFGLKKTKRKSIIVFGHLWRWTNSIYNDRLWAQSCGTSRDFFLLGKIHPKCVFFHVTFVRRLIWKSLPGTQQNHGENWRLHAFSLHFWR